MLQHSVIQNYKDFGPTLNKIKVSPVCCSNESLFNANALEIFLCIKIFIHRLSFFSFYRIYKIRFLFIVDN